MANARPGALARAFVETSRSDTSDVDRLVHSTTVPIDADLLSERYFGATLVSMGWPWLAMSAAELNQVRWDDDTVRSEYQVTQFMEIEGINSQFVTRPLLLGFTMDTVIYGTTWLGLIMCPGIARRRLRESRGQCPSCGYDNHRPATVRIADQEPRATNRSRDCAPESRISLGWIDRRSHRDSLPNTLARGRRRRF